MSPYRTPPGPNDDEHADEHVRDDRALGAMLLVFGGIRLATALAQHEVWGSESTVALFMVALSVGLVVRKRGR